MCFDYCLVPGIIHPLIWEIRYIFSEPSPYLFPIGRNSPNIFGPIRANTARCARRSLLITAAAVELFQKFFNIGLFFGVSWALGNGSQRGSSNDLITGFYGNVVTQRIESSSSVTVSSACGGWSLGTGDRLLALRRALTVIWPSLELDLPPISL